MSARAKRTVAANPRLRFHEAFSLWNGVFLLAGICLGCVVFYLVAPRSLSLSAQGKQREPDNLVASNRWGQLEVTPIMLERPEEYSEADRPLRDKIVWFFRPQDPGALREFFAGCALPEPQLQVLSDTNQWEISPRGIRITPPMDLVRDLAPGPRERLYRLLARSPANGPQRSPYRCQGDSFKEWFASCDLPQEKLNQVERMTYLRGGVLCFSDLEYLQLSWAPEEVRRISRVLSRVGSLLVYLRITPATDIQALLQYWGTTSRAKKVKPLVESVKRVPEGGILNISWFFPPVPRLLVYSYPNPTNTVAADYPDCFWTALNFHRDTAEDRFLDSDVAAAALDQDYYRVPRPEQFGDLIYLIEQEKRELNPVHICVYVAADIVFTKNGLDPRQPWVLMHMHDMMEVYQIDKPLMTVAFRRKPR
jgi:hypothetical protein